MRHPRPLTPRRREVLQGLLEGSRPVVIAEACGITRARVDQIINDLEGLGLLCRYGYREYAVTPAGQEALRRP